MSQDEKNTEDFFDTLSKKSNDDKASSPGVLVLRHALRKQIDTVRSVETQKHIELTAEEKRKMEAVKQHLIENGLLNEPENEKKETKKQTDIAEWLNKTLFGTGWQQPIAMAASLLIVSLVVPWAAGCY